MLFYTRFQDFIFTMTIINYFASAADFAASAAFFKLGTDVGHVVQVYMHPLGT